jgi:hypothetical protein
MNELYHKFLMEALANLTEEIKILKAEVKELKEKDHHYAPSRPMANLYDAGAHLNLDKFK